MWTTATKRLPFQSVQMLAGNWQKYQLVSRHVWTVFLGLFLFVACERESNPRWGKEARTVVTGKVIGISDGDTIKLLVAREQVTVRLDGIDAPEFKQSYGQKAKQALSDYVFGREVTVEVTSEDRFGRAIGDLWLEGSNINERMIDNGWAWHFKATNSDPRFDRLARFASLEKEAKDARRGLWADESPVAPWDFRLRQVQAAREPATVFWLNTSSNVRHNPSCEHFKKSKKGRFCGETEGNPCRICGG